MPELCGLPNVTFLFGLLLIAALIEAVTHWLLKDWLGWQPPPDTTPDARADYEARRRLVAGTLAVLAGIGICWAFGIGIFQWLGIGKNDPNATWVRALDYLITGVVIGGGTGVVGALLNAWGLFPGLPFERKPQPQALPAANSAPATSPSQPAPPGIIARTVLVDALPGVFGKSLVVPPGYAGVLYHGEVAATSLPPGTHTVRRIGAREPILAALIDTHELTLEPTSHNLETADGERLDWTWRARVSVSDPLQFATRVLAGQPLVDRRALANWLAVESESAIQGIVREYATDTLLEQSTANAHIARRARAPFAQLCAEHGLAVGEFAAVDFAPAMDEARAIEQLQASQAEIAANAPIAQTVKTLEEKSGATPLLTPAEAQQLQQTLAQPDGQARGIALLGRAVERKLNELRQRVEDQIEQTLLRERKPSKMDKFTQRNVRLLAWATRLKLIGGVIVSALTLVGVLAPNLAPNDTSLKLGGAAFGLIAALAAFLGSLWMDSEYHQRKQDYDRGWLNRLSAERVLASDAATRARTATELGKAAAALRATRQRIATQRTATAIRLKEIEEQANRLAQELQNAETGEWRLRIGERVSAVQAQRLLNLETALWRDAEKLTQTSGTLATLVAQAQWDQVDAHIAPLDATLMTLRQRFADRAQVLRGAAG